MYQDGRSGLLKRTKGRYGNCRGCLLLRPRRPEQHPLKNYRETLTVWAKLEMDKTDKRALLDSESVILVN